MERWDVGSVSLGELWAVRQVAESCAGSKRWLVGCLGGWGNCPALAGDSDSAVEKQRERGLVVRWKVWTGKEEEKGEEWGGMEVDQTSTERSGGW